MTDDIDQAAEDLTAEWRREARQSWVLDTDAVAGDDGARRPDLARRTDTTMRIARLRAWRDAVAAVAPDAEDRPRVLVAQLRLEQVAQPIDGDSRSSVDEPSRGDDSRRSASDRTTLRVR